MKTRHAAAILATFVTLFCLGTASRGQLASDGWPKFRANIRNTGQSPYIGPAIGALDWSFTTGAAISGSPAIGADGTVYFVSQDQNLYAVDSSGNQLWQLNIGSTNISSPAIAADGTIYVGSENYNLYAINPDGTIKWQKDLGRQVRSSPTVGSDGTVYVGTMSGKVYAYTAAGVLRWSIQTGNAIASSPAIAPNGTIYVGCEDNYLYAIDPTGSGRVKWRYATAGWLDTSPAVSPDGSIVYIASANGRLYAINAGATSGTLRWSYAMGGACKSSPAIGADGIIYVGADDDYLYAFNTNGTRKWRYKTSGNVQSSPAIGSDGTIYFGSFDNKVYALNPSGNRIWEYALGGQTYSSPAIGPDGALYIGCNDTKLYSFARDRTPPLTPVVTDDGVFTTNSTTLHASWVTTDPDTSIIDIQYAIGTSPGGTNIVNWTSVGTAMSVTKSGLSLVNGVTYYFSVKAQNEAYSWSAVGISDGITLDQTPAQTPVVNDDGDYTSSPDTLHATWSAIDPESGIVEYQYCIGTTVGGTNVVPWTSAGSQTEVTRTGLSLGQNVTYYFTVKALDGAGFWSANGSSNGITVDKTAPPAPVVTDDGEYSPTNTSLHATWTGSDPESGVGEYQYAVGTTSGGTNIVGWTTTGTDAQVTSSGLSLADGTVYYVSVKIRNRAGLWGPVGVSNGITIDASPPTTPVVTDDGAYTTSSNTLHASWTSSEPHTAVAEYEYAIGTTAGGVDVLGWTSTGTNAQVTKTGLSLTSGVRYYFTVRAKNRANVWSTPGNSDGITVDLTPPLTPIVVDDGQFTSVNNTLHASWTSSDAESTVVEYQYAIGTSPGGTDVANWTSIGTELQVTRTGLSLADGVTYYFTVKARNGVDMWSDLGTSNGITVDASPPPAPVVTDDGAFTASSTTLHATWTCADSHSGIVEYQYAIGTTPGGVNVVGWTSTGTTAEVTKTGLTLAHDATYYFTVKARNGSDVWSGVGNSDGILVDLTAPPAPLTVTDDGVYTPDNTSLHATWTASDPESGIIDYQYAIGTAAGGTNIVNWTSTNGVPEVTRTGLSLTNGIRYYISVKARNGAGTWGIYKASDGIIVDATPPTALTITDDGQYTALNTQLHATWSASDGESAVAEYQYAIGTTAGGSDVVGWTSAGSDTQVTKTGLSLTDGVTYYISMKARNGAGVWSAPVATDGIIVDASPPSAPIVIDDGQYTASTSTLHASWSAVDSHSGVAEYQYAIGTTPGGTNVVGWTSTGTATEVNKTGLALTHNTTYYFTVKAKNRAGLWGPTGVSDGILVDATAPPAPSVTDDGQYTSDNTSLHATWTGADPESGITEYQYAIGTVANGTNVVGWTLVGNVTEITKTGLSLTNGTKYYISVKARNGAGTWSAFGASDGITVDATPPNVLTVTDDGQYTTLNTQLHATWTASDNESGLAEYQYAIGTTAGGTDVAGWTSTGTDPQVTRSDLSLTDGVTYYFAVRARNQAGLWGTPAVSDGIIVDSTSPSLPVVIDDAFTASSTSLHATWSSSDPHSGIAQYQYAIGTTPGGTNTLNWTSAGTSTEVTRTGLSLTHNTTYYISVKSKNNAGLWSSVGTGTGVLVDTTAPSQPSVTDDGEYTAIPILHATWGSTDAESGLAEYQYAIGTTSGGVNVVGWTAVGSATEITRSDLNLIVGTRYYFAVKARNRAGTWSITGVTDGIMFDNTPPALPVVTDDGQYTTNNTSLHATWACADAESGIAEFNYAIGTAPGDISVVDWTSTGTTANFTKTGLSLIDGVTYYISVRGRNRAGLTSDLGYSDGIMVDASAPATPVVTDDAYTDSTNTLHAVWTSDDLHSGIADNQYAIGTTPGGTNIVYWTSTGVATEVTRTALNLVQNTTYYFTVKSKNRAGLWSANGTSTGVLVDNTPPPAPIVTDDGQYTTIGTSLHATWTCADPESGIAEYQYAVGTTSGGTNVRGWTSVGTVTDYTIPDLILVDGTMYYISVRARNRVGRFGNPGVSNGIIVDASPPTTPVVIDDGDNLQNLDMLHATWSSSDPHTGVAEYQYAIGTTPGGVDTIPWTSIGTATEVTRTGLSLSGGETYYFAVKARNNAGGWSLVGQSDGIVADHTPPTTPVIVQDARYTSNTTSLHATWSSSDPESGVVEYQYAIGTTPGGSDLSVWASVGTATEATKSGLTLIEGVTYYFAVKAKNKVHLWSEVGIAEGVTVDTSGPTVSAVNDDGEYTLSLDTLHASWVAFDPQSGIVEYQYCVGTSERAADIAGWTSAGTLADVTRGGLSLIDGGTYYFSVRAKNGAGLWGSVGGSDGITVAISAAWPKFRADAQNHGVSRFFGSRLGVLLWQYPTYANVESSPALSGDGTAYVGSDDGSVYAVSRQGNLVWQFETGGSVDSSPAIGTDGSIYIGSYDTYLYCLSGGTMRWRYKTGDRIRSSPAVGPDNTVYFGSYDDRVYAIRPNVANNAATLVWKYVVGTTPGGYVWSSPALSADGTVLYFGASDGYIYAVNTANGTLKWRCETGTAVDSSPSIGPDGTVYAGSGDGYLYALNPETGAPRWTFYTGGWVVDSSAAIGADGTVYVGCGQDWSYGVLYAIEPADGSVKWAFEVDGGVRSSPAISSEGIIYFGSHDGCVYAVKPDGALKWSYNTGFQIFSSAAIGRDGRVVIGSSSAYLYTFKDSNVDDVTAPTSPTVVDEGASTTSTTTLSAAWIANDPESGIVEYKYAIGKWPGTADIVPWTSVGVNSSITKTGLTLEPGETYYFSVKAINPANMESPVGASDGIQVVGPQSAVNIGPAKELPDEWLVTMNNKVVTAQFDGLFYVEEADRSAGIKVFTQGDVPPVEGARVTVSGNMITDGGERAVRLNTLQSAGTMEIPGPVGMSNEVLGGGPSPGLTIGVDGGQGLNNLGLLVSAWGRVTSTGEGWFFIDDGSGVLDQSGAMGVKVSLTGLFPGRTILTPMQNDYVRVTGIASIEPASTTYRRLLRPRMQSDVVIMQ